MGGDYYSSKLLNGNISGILSKQLSVIGITNGQKQIPAAINVLAKKAVDMTPFVTKEYKFEQADQGLKEFSENAQKYHKIMIKV